MGAGKEVLVFEIRSWKHLCKEAKKMKSTGIFISIFLLILNSLSKLVCGLCMIWVQSLKVSLRERMGKAWCYFIG